MYTTVLFLHSWVRWAVLLLGLLAIYRGASGLAGGRRFLPADRKVGLFFLISVDIQLLLGLALYLGLSPVAQMAMAKGGAMMKETSLRFWGVEHLLTGVLAWLAAHVAWVSIKRGQDDPTRLRRLAVGAAVALVLAAARLPWPFLGEVGRPLFRLG